MRLTRIWIVALVVLGSAGALAVVTLARAPAPTLQATASASSSVTVGGTATSSAATIAPPTVSAAVTASPGRPSASPAPSASSTVAPTVTDATMTGTWKVVADSTVEAAFTAGVGPFQSDVVATTTAVDGSANLRGDARGLTVTAGRFTVTNARLSTGDATYDGQLQSILETDRYPTSRFEQTGAIQLADSGHLTAGTRVTLQGNLTLHGVTRAVAVPSRITLAAGRITVDSTIAFRLADYAIHGSGLVSVGDTGTITFHVVLGQ